MRRGKRWMAWLVLPVLMLACYGVARSQSSAPPDKAPETRDFEEAFERWRAYVGRLWALDIDYRTHVDEARRAQVKKEFDALLEEGDKLTEEMVNSAVTAFVKANSENLDLLPFLITLVNSEMQADHYESALRVAQLLIDNEVADRYRVHDLYTAAGTAAYLCNDFELAQKHLAKAKELNKLPPASQGIDMMGGGEEADFTPGDYYNFTPQYIEFWKREKALRDAERAANDLPRVVLRTNKGEIEIELFEKEAPNTVANFIRLVEEGYYDGQEFYRVEAGKWAKTGDPKNDGTGNPGFIIPHEYPLKDSRMHFRGSVSMESEGPFANGSRFLITFEPSPKLDGAQTVFGRVVRGMDVLAKLQRRIPRDPVEVMINPHRNIVIPKADVIESARVVRKRDHGYDVTRFPIPEKRPGMDPPVDR